MDATTGSMAHVIRARMEEVGVTLTDLSGAAGIPLTTLHRRLNAPQPFRWDEMVAVAKVLNTSVAHLVAVSESAAS